MSVQQAPQQLVFQRNQNEIALNVRSLPTGGKAHELSQQNREIGLKGKVQPTARTQKNRQHSQC